MMSRKFLAVALLAGGLCGLPAAAGAQSGSGGTHNWTGWHLGLHAGYGWNSGGVSLSPLDAFAASYFMFNTMPERPIDGSRGLLGGGQIGYDVQVGKFVYGVEADLSFTGMDSKNVSDVFFFVTNHVTLSEQKLENFGTLRARIGVTPFEGALLYATGGLAFGRVNVANSLTLIDFTGAPLCGAATGLCATGGTKEWTVGWTIGAGWEQAFSRNWSMKLEGLYYDLGSVSHTFQDPTVIPGPDPVFKASASFKGEIVRLGVNYKFD